MPHDLAAGCFGLRIETQFSKYVLNDLHVDAGLIKIFFPILPSDQN